MGSNQLFLAVEQHTSFGEQVPIQVGTNFQDEILAALPPQDLDGLVDEVKRGIVCRVVSQVTELTEAEIRKEIDKELKKAKEEVEWNLESLKGRIKLTKAVTIPAQRGVTGNQGYYG